MQQDFDPYVILGIRPESTIEEIKQRYQELGDRLNPNKNSLEAAKHQYKMIHAAYELLTDSVRRRKYDEQMRNAPSAKPNFMLRVLPSKKAIVPMGEEQVIYLLAEIYASANAQQQVDNREIHLNLTLVIDQSKSMDDEGRMDKVKAAAQTIITELGPQDIISIVAFNDRANIVIPATHVQDKMSLRARLGMLQPKGATAIYEGLSEGVKQNRKFLSPQMVNHIILLTDGRTYGDEPQCLQLAQKIAQEGITLSAMGLGTDWNDTFLDQLASATGGGSAYIRTVNMVTQFLDDQVRNLSNAFAERMQLSIATDPDVHLEMAFKISPHPQPLVVEGGLVPLSSLPPTRPISVLLQLQLPKKLDEGPRNIARIVATGDIMVEGVDTFRAVSDLTLDIVSNPSDVDDTPSPIVEALAKLTLYRLQEKAQEAMERGDVETATRTLQYLATRLIELGEDSLGRQAMSEADVIAKTRAFSNEDVKKTMKYSTRALISDEGMRDAITKLFNSDKK